MAIMGDGLKLISESVVDSRKMHNWWWCVWTTFGADASLASVPLVLVVPNLSSVAIAPLNTSALFFFDVMQWSISFSSPYLLLVFNPFCRLVKTYIQVQDAKNVCEFFSSLTLFEFAEPSLTCSQNWCVCSIFICKK